MVARLEELSHVEWPQLLRYDPGDWYKSHRDTFHNYQHPALAERQLSGPDDGLNPELENWKKWLGPGLTEWRKTTGAGAGVPGRTLAIQTPALVEGVLSRAKALALTDDPLSNEFELAVIGLCLAANEQHEHMDAKTADWVRHNYERPSVHYPTPQPDACTT